VILKSIRRCLRCVAITVFFLSNKLAQRTSLHATTLGGDLYRVGNYRESEKQLCIEKSDSWRDKRFYLSLFSESEKDFNLLILV
jgi:hypothetical protein